MATLDDKLLGEKLQNYCSSSSEDEGDDKGDEGKSRGEKAPKFIPEAELKEKGEPLSLGAGGPAQNTGPKGVIKDWQRYKQLENQKNAESQEERRRLIKRLALSCRSDDIEKSLEKEGINKEEVAAAAAAAAVAANAAAGTSGVSDQDLENDLLQDDFFKEYIRKKFEEMQNRTLTLPRFGKVLELTNEKFLDEIDNENKNVTIIIHIYDTRIAECRIMNECLESIAPTYPFVKFCKVRSTEISLSDRFKKTGCPALLIYKNGELIGNFVKMGDEFGQEFCASDVENFLIEQGFLPSQDVPSLIRSSNKDEASDDDN